MIKKIYLSQKVLKNLKKIPKHILEKLDSWIEIVNAEGIEEARRIPSFHDEPLQGKRIGQRSIRLNRQWRAIYSIHQNGDLYIQILEVTPHDYR